MKAIVQNRFGSTDVLEFSDIDTPAIDADDVLVRVHAASIGPWVWRMIRPDPRIMRFAGAGLLRPKNRVPGADMAGVVEAVGANVTLFEPGDEVYGETIGTFAEYCSASQDALAIKPRNLSFEEAAAVPVAGSTALVGLRDHGKLMRRQHVLIIGAAGGVGTFAVQIAKVLGAEVTGVCSTSAIDLVRSLGADHVIDYTQEDFTDSGRQYHVVFQLAGDQSSDELRRVMTPTGTLVLSSGEGGHWIGPIGRIGRAIVTSPFIDQTLRAFVQQPNRDYLLTLTDYIEAGRVRPIIDRTYSLRDAAEAIRHVENGHARGKTIVTI